MPHSKHKLDPRLATLLLLTVTLSLSGCGHWGGIGYFLGFGRRTKIEALNTLPENTLLILVDDPAEKVRWPRARNLLAQYVGEELLTHKAVSAVVRPASLAKLRRMDPAFETYSATTVGRKLGAETVLFIEVRDFFAPKDIQDTSTAAKLTVSVRVLDVTQREHARKVRLWPTDPGGHIVESTLRAVEVHALKGENATPTELARKAAIYTGRVFYDHTLGDIDDEP